MAQKAVSILMRDGNLDGITTMESTSWKGVLYATPRAAVNDLVSETAKMYGIYLLLSKDMVYVGQSTDLSKRLKQHDMKKAWWDRAIVLTTNKENWLNKSDIDYLEYVLINKALHNNKLSCDNKKDGNPPIIDQYRKVGLDQYLEEALLLLDILGVTVFAETKKKIGRKNSSQTMQPTSIKSETTVKELNADVLLNGGVASANYFKKFLIEKNLMQQGGKSTIAKINKDGSGRYWANPPIKYIYEDWILALNNTLDRQLYIFKIPANAISEKDLNTRITKSGTVQIDLEIVKDNDKFVCASSKLDYTPWYFETWNY